jgi:glucose/arabinose dehydrogenase
MRLVALGAAVLPALTAVAQPAHFQRLNAVSFNRPILVTQPPGETNRLFVVEQGGVVHIMDASTGVRNATPFLTVPSVRSGGEAGLLGLAFHPDYASNGCFFVYYNRVGSTTDSRVIARFRVDPANPDIADPASRAVILEYPAQTANHNGGWTAFGPDGNLYIAWGDRGSSANAADIMDNLLGKVLRLDVDGPDNIPGNADDDQFPADPLRNYCIPSDNPFVGIEGDDEIWAYGLRNPWRNSFDRATGELYIADVGAGRWEEVNHAPAPPGAAGRNYGWPCMEGLVCLSGTTCACNTPALTPPVHVYPISGTPECAISGGYVYRGCAMPWLNGLYFFGDYCSGRVWTGQTGGGTLSGITDRSAEMLPATRPTIYSFGEDSRGELYLCAGNGGVYKLVPTTLASQCRCASADFDGDGDVGTDADIRAFFVCLVEFCDGSNFPHLTSDFNGDGDTGTDADIEAFFRVLAGGYC